MRENQRGANFNGDKVQTIILLFQTHVGILQTALDFIKADYEVHIVADATSSRKPNDQKLALKRIKQSGGFITSCESVIMMLLKDSAHPKFCEIRELLI